VQTTQNYENTVQWLYTKFV